MKIYTTNFLEYVWMQQYASVYTTITGLEPFCHPYNGSISDVITFSLIPFLYVNTAILKESK